MGPSSEPEAFREWGNGRFGSRICTSDIPGRSGPVDAVNGIDLEIDRGECFGLLGPNGAGKTTTVEIVEGLNQPTSGEVQKSWG